jgi:ATP phosphoribosyltransferase
MGLPSKGILQKNALDFLANCGLSVLRLNPRQYAATIPNLPEITVLFQRPGDIVIGVRQGTLDFGITGLDIVAEYAFGIDKVLILHEALGFGPCSLNLAVPEDLPQRNMADLRIWAQDLQKNGQVMRVATKFPNLTKEMLDSHSVRPYRLISPEGTLEIAPVIGFADLIADLVSSGMTLRDNHLRLLDDGLILKSEACLLANKEALNSSNKVLDVARKLLEFMEAHLRADGSYTITANVRGDSPEQIARMMFDKAYIGGLQGPTISQVVTRENIVSEKRWYAVNIVVKKQEVFNAVTELRQIGGSGVIVSPCTYIFEEEPQRYRAMLDQLDGPR